MKWRIEPTSRDGVKILVEDESCELVAVVTDATEGDLEIIRQASELRGLVRNLVWTALDWDGESEWVDVRKDVFDELFKLVDGGQLKDPLRSE